MQLADMSDQGFNPEQELSYKRALLFLQLAIGEVCSPGLHSPMLIPLTL